MCLKAALRAGNMRPNDFEEQVYGPTIADRRAWGTCGGAVVDTTQDLGVFYLTQRAHTTLCATLGARQVSVNQKRGLLWASSAVWRARSPERRSFAEFCPETGPQGSYLNESLCFRLEFSHRNRFAGSHAKRPQVMHPFDYVNKFGRVFCSAPPPELADPLRIHANLRSTM